MTNRVTFFGALALAIGCSVAGYQYAAALYGEDIAALREDYASRSQALEEKYREKECSISPLSRRGKSVIKLWLMSSVCLMTLTGCASKQPTLAVDCPHPPVVPATLKESSLPAAQTYSKEARSWFEEVSNYLSALR